MSEAVELKKLAQGLSLLYAEDNEPLRLNASKLLENFFTDLRSAEDGESALELFKKRAADILITDIKMPHRDGLSLIKAIRELAPHTKCIIMSAFDDKPLLLEAINSGVYAYLKKPVNLIELTQTLLKAVLEIKKEHENELFLLHMQTIFNYQSSMVALLEGKNVVVANQLFLDFFKDRDIGSHFLAHDGFLYNYAGIDWFDVAAGNEKKLFHVKMQDASRKMCHFILKYKSIPAKKSYAILSFDDITELNLLGLFDAKKAKNDEEIEKNHSLYKLLEVLQRNSAELEVHNFYKGLSITNSGIISEVKKDSLFIKSSFLQLKGIQFERKTLLVSEALPFHLECTILEKIGFETQVAVLSGLRFVETSAVQRKTIRVSVEEKHNVSLFLNEKKFHAEIEIEDISLNAIRLSLGALPAGLEKGDLVRLDIVLALDKRPIILNTDAKVYTKVEHRHAFSVVFLFDGIQKSELVKYITKRQMAIIREFKGLQNG